MAEVRRGGKAYTVIERECLGRPCFQPGAYQVRGGTPSGSRATGQERLCCLRNAYHGCPDDYPTNATAELRSERRKEGWR